MTRPDLAARIAAQAPNRRRPAVMLQRWESLLFLHWRIAPARIQETLPVGLTVDTFEGDAYLGVVPFFMRKVRPIGSPAISRISNFQELNVRTYVFDRRGIPGVWFYSLDCNQPLAVKVARALTGLEYFHAEMRATTNDFIDYTSRRAGTDEVARYRYRAAGETRETEPSSLEFFLLQRYYLYAIRSGRLVRGQVSHRPYRPRGAELAIASSIPAWLDGFHEITNDAEHICFEDGFDVRIYGTERVA